MGLSGQNGTKLERPARLCRRCGPQSEPWHVLRLLDPRAASGGARGYGHAAAPRRKRHRASHARDLAAAAQGGRTVRVSRRAAREVLADGSTDDARATECLERRRRRRPTNPIRCGLDGAAAATTCAASTASATRRPTATSTSRSTAARAGTHVGLSSTSHSTAARAGTHVGYTVGTSRSTAARAGRSVGQSEAALAHAHARSDAVRVRRRTTRPAHSGGRRCVSNG